MGEVTGASRDKKTLVFKTDESFEWTGLRPDREPQDLPKNTPQKLTNMRIRGGRMEERGGQQETVDIGFPITGMIDMENLGPDNSGNRTGDAGALYITCDKGFGVFLDEKPYDDTLPDVFKSLYKNTDTGVVHRVGKSLYGDFLAFAKNGIESSSPATLCRLDIPAYSSLWNPPETEGISPFEIVEIFRHASVVLVAVNHRSDYSVGNNASSVYAWNGTSFIKETSFEYPITGAGLYRDSAFVLLRGVDDNPPEGEFSGAHFRSAAGVWSWVEVDTDALYGTKPSTSVSYKDRLYVPFLENIFEYSGTGTLNQITPATTGVDSGVNVAGISSCERLLGNMYYVWATTVGADSGKSRLLVGKFDGLNWDAEYKDLSAQIGQIDTEGTSDRTGRLYSFPTRAFKGELYIAIKETSLDPVEDYVVLYRTIGGDVAGDWERLKVIDNLGEHDFVYPTSLEIL